MTFPVPDRNTSESADSQRDERKRLASPPSSFFAQSQAILNSVDYFEPLNSGYEGTARKHRNRTRSSLFVQLMAAFEFTMKDFIAQTLDTTHIYDDAAKTWDWLSIDVPTVMSTREGFTRLGAVLIHPLVGWQTPETLNSRYLDVYKCQPVAKDEIQALRDLWIIRHSIAHNGGVVTEPDARRLRAPNLANQPVLVDREYLAETVIFLRRIVQRLQDVVGPLLLRRWFAEASAGDWQLDEDQYRRLKLLTTYVPSRPQELPSIGETEYDADALQYRPAA